MRPVLLLLLFALTGPLWANAAPPPDNYEVRSPNGEWIVRCHRREATQRVHKLGASEAAWTFDVTDPWNQDYFISNDGAAVAVVGPWWVKSDELDRPAVRIFTRTGVLAEFRHEALCPRMEKSTSGGGWLWRAEQSNNILIIKAQDGTLSRISLETGRLLAQEKFEIEEERARSHCTTTTAASLAAAGALGLPALLAAVVVLRRRRAASRG